VRSHPWLLSALRGLVVGIVAGVAFYVILRATGTHVNRYLLVAVVCAFIPGSIMLSELLEADELEALDWEDDGRERETGRPPSAS
jgi:hypothetical protein